MSRQSDTLLSLKGRSALVTGACGEIGRAICRGLGASGCHLHLLDRDRDNLDHQTHELRERYSTQVEFHCIDLEDELQRATLSKRVNELDILINNAAFVGDSALPGWVSNFTTQSLSTWRRAMEVNLTACFHLSQLLAPRLSANEGGTIINVASIHGLVGPDLRLYDGTDMGNPAAYASGKGGLIQLTRWLSTVLAPRIRVNSVSPGGLFRNQPKQFVHKYVDRTPLKRMACADDVMGAVLFLSSDLSSYVTGHNLIVDGGWTAW